MKSPFKLPEGKRIEWLGLFAVFMSMVAGVSNYYLYKVTGKAFNFWLAELMCFQTGWCAANYENFRAREKFFRHMKKRLGIEDP